MTDNAKRWCVLVPCSNEETWAVPLNCLAEVVTLHTDAASPPQRVTWRDRSVPVLDLGSADGSTWRAAGRGTGLVAIFLGLQGEGCEYWGLAIRGDGPRIVCLTGDAVEDVEEVQQHATAAFRYHGTLCQVPDLDRFQRQMAGSRQVA